MRSEHIQQQLVSHGRRAATPSPSSSGHHGPSAGADRHLADLAELAQQAVSPSLIVIGEVVALRQQLAWFGEQGQEAESGHELKLVSLA